MLRRAFHSHAEIMHAGGDEWNHKGITEYIQESCISRSSENVFRL